MYLSGRRYVVPLKYGAPRYQSNQQPEECILSTNENVCLYYVWQGKPIRLVVASNQLKPLSFSTLCTMPLFKHMRNEGRNCMKKPTTAQDRKQQQQQQQLLKRETMDENKTEKLRWML